MFYGRLSAFWILAVVTLLSPPADGQSVISTHSGIIHFFEGTVYLGDQLLESHPGRFLSVPEGGELRTANGRAEVLLTPGVFVRLGEQSTIRMVANALSNTRVELLAGSVIVDSAEQNLGTSVTLLYKNWSVRFPEQGVYRINSDPPRLWVFQGEAEVSAGGNERALLIKQGMNLPFASVLVPERSADPPDDALSRWADGRQQSISADNTIAANIQDPASLPAANPGADAFTHFPILGLSSNGPGYSIPYGSSIAYQPGFNSIYLPGYTYLPLLVGVYSTGFATPFALPYGSSVFSFPRHSPPPRPLAVPLGAPHPVYSPHPTPVYSIPGAGGHIGGRR